MPIDPDPGRARYTEALHLNVCLCAARNAMSASMHYTSGFMSGLGMLVSVDLSSQPDHLAKQIELSSLLLLFFSLLFSSFLLLFIVSLRTTGLQDRILNLSS